MIGNSNNRLFGGANKSIIEAYEKMQARKLEEAAKRLEEAKSVSDAECSDKKLDDACSMKKEDTLHEEVGHESLVARLKEDGLNHIETQDQGAFNVSVFSSENLTPEKIEHLNSMVGGQGELKVEGDNVKLITKKSQSDFEAPKKQIYESNDYIPFMNRQEFESAASKHSLNLVSNDEHHTEALDGSGDLKGWWNGHTGVGYIRKDCGQYPLESNTLQEFFEELNDSHLILSESADERVDEDLILESVVRRMPEHLKEEYVNLNFEGKTDLHHNAYDRDGSKGESKIGKFHWEQWRANARAMIKKGAE